MGSSLTSAAAAGARAAATAASARHKMTRTGSCPRRNALFAGAITPPDACAAASAASADWARALSSSDALSSPFARTRAHDSHRRIAVTHAARAVATSRAPAHATAASNARASTPTGCARIALFSPPRAHVASSATRAAEASAAARRATSPRTSTATATAAGSPRGVHRRAVANRTCVHPPTRFDGFARFDEDEASPPPRSVSESPRTATLEKNASAPTTPATSRKPSPSSSLASACSSSYLSP
eukprot:29982-Pelagococcus_subviridis.AAC.5